LKILILTGKLCESLIIGDGVTVKFVAMENTQKKSGIDAPEKVIISREEVYTKIVWV
jgi:carbon storage regulator